MTAGLHWPTPAATHDDVRTSLLRHIAAHPDRVACLRDLVAEQLEAVADAVEESEPPTVEVAAEAIRDRAEATRHGEVHLW